VDRTQVKPRVAIIGEFWAMTTEGDGNYHLQRFLEQEGAEVDVPSITAWLLYLVWTSRYDTRTRMRLTRADDGRRGLQGVHVRSRLLGLWLVERALTAGFHCCAKLMGCKGCRLPDMNKLAEVSHHYYNSNNRGGEGHMEVGKLILNAVSNKVDLTVSVKPFGCLPSSCVSDGVQSSIIGLHPGALFLPIETSGDGAANVYSRAEMQLSKARERAEKEFQNALHETGQTLETFRRRVAARSVHRHALQYSLQKTGCTAADLVYEVGRLYRS
jgi:predicted nucleotide-binding protein (sugar kinase/HSP70/actin superfamily)